MSPRVSYVCEAEGLPVYLYDDGTYRHDYIGAEPLSRCKFCNRFTSYGGTKQCNGCWEVSGRLPEFLRSENAREYVRKRLAEGRRLMSWISVKDRLPEDLRTVLTFVKGNGVDILGTINFGYYDRDKCWYVKDDIADLVRCDDVTHWQPLPAPPEDR